MFSGAFLNRNNMTKEEEQQLELERKELNLLIQKGVKFELERKVYKRPRGLFGFLKKRIASTQKLTFTINEPTLSTLDRLSVEEIELEMDENIMTSSAGLSEAKKLTSKHSLRLARIIALAVLGQEYVKMIQEGPRVRYKYDNKSLEKLTTLFFHNIKPSKLMELAMMVGTMSNLGDFCNSIRLMSANRTTMPIRIEEKED